MGTSPVEAFDNRTLGSLEIGDKVEDSSWELEFRSATLAGTLKSYWTCSPHSEKDAWVKAFFRGFGRNIARSNDGGVRPTLNLESATPITAAFNAAGVYELFPTAPGPGSGAATGLYDPADGVLHLEGEAPYRYGPLNSNWLPLAGKW